MNDRDQPRIGVIGLGRFGTAHVEALISAGCPPVAVADPDPAALARIRAMLPEVSTYPDAVELITTAGLEAVTIAAPSSTHAELAVAAAAQGLVTLVEKPVATTSAELDQLIMVSRPELVLPGHVLRHDAAHQALKHLVDGGRIGTVRMITASRHRDAGHLVAFDDPDPLFLTQVHDLDLALWLDGSVPTSVACVGTARSDRYPSVSTQARSPHGVTWSLIASYLLVEGTGARDRLEVVGDTGTALLTVGADGSRLTLSAAEEELVGTWPPADAPGLHAEMTALIDRLRDPSAETPDDSAATLEDAAAVIRLALAARSSLRHGGAVTTVDPGRAHPSTQDPTPTDGGRTPPDEALIPRSDWHELTGSYLYTGAQAPALTAVGDAIRAAFDLQSGGAAGRAALADVELGAQATVARWAGCDPSDVAFTGDASTVWNMVAGGLAWEPGDNVIINNLEHPSVSFPFLRQAGRGLQSRVLDGSVHGLIEPADIAAAIDGRTRAVIISHVSYVNGARHDVAAMAQIADQAGIPLFVDWSHSLGVLPVDSSLCAIGVSASYKWALGPYGVGVAIWNRDRLPEFQPGLVGWRSTPDFFHDDRYERIRLGETAERFRLGAASYAGIAGLGAGLDRLLTIGPERVGAHALRLAGAAHTALVERGFDVITPVASERRAGSVAVRHDRAMDLADALARRGVLVWAGDGRFRASFHVMSSGHDVTALVDAVAQAHEELT